MFSETPSCNSACVLRSNSCPECLTEHVFSAAMTCSGRAISVSLIRLQQHIAKLEALDLNVRCVTCSEGIRDRE